MDEQFDPVICPHAPSPLPGRLHKDGREIDPVGVDSIIDIRIWLYPIAIDITGVWFFGAKAAVNIDLLDARPPERFHGRAQTPKKPAAPRCEPKMPLYLVQRRLMIARR